MDKPLVSAIITTYKRPSLLNPHASDAAPP